MPCKSLENKTNTSLSLGELIDKYILEHSVNWAASTTKSFTNKFEAMKNVLSNGVMGGGVDSYNRDSYITYRNELAKQGYSSKSINDPVKLLSPLLR